MKISLELLLLPSLRAKKLKENCFGKHIKFFITKVKFKCFGLSAIGTLLFRDTSNSSCS